MTDAAITLERDVHVEMAAFSLDATLGAGSNGDRPSHPPESRRSRRIEMHDPTSRFGSRSRHLFALASILCMGGLARADEERLVPLNALGERTYRGFVGGL